MALPNWIGIGSGRCGTTTVHALLESHYQVFTPPEKELNFFNIERIEDSHLNKYKEIFEKGRNFPSRGEITPGYMFSPAAPRNIREIIGKDASLIVNIRHPVDRLFSHYLLQVQGLMEFRSFEEAYHPDDGYFHASRYAHFLKEWANTFGRECFFLMIYEEDIKKDVTKGMKRLFKFLGIDEIDVSPLHINEARYPMPSFYNATGLEISPEEANSGGPIIVKRIVINGTRHETGGQVVHDNPDEAKIKQMYALARTVTRRLNPDFRQHIFDKFFIDDISALEDMFQRDLSVWR